MSWSTPRPSTGVRATVESTNQPSMIGGAAADRLRPPTPAGSTLGAMHGGRDGSETPAMAPGGEGRGRLCSLSAAM
jgi:hypothetical protein